MKNSSFLDKPCSFWNTTLNFPAFPKDDSITPSTPPFVTTFNPTNYLSNIESNLTG